MRFDKFIKSVAPAIAMAVASGAKGCESSTFTFNGKEGVRLSDLDLSGDAPDEVNLMGADIVRIVEGEDFGIALEGDDDPEHDVGKDADARDEGGDDEQQADQHGIDVEVLAEAPAHPGDHLLRAAPVEPARHLCSHGVSSSVVKADVCSPVGRAGRGECCSR